MCLNSYKFKYQFIDKTNLEIGYKKWVFSIMRYLKSFFISSLCYRVYNLENLSFCLNLFLKNLESWPLIMIKVDNTQRYCGYKFLKFTYKQFKIHYRFRLVGALTSYVYYYYFYPVL